MRLYLHQDYIDVLQLYGKVPDVVNRVVTDCLDNGIQVEDLPPCPPQDGTVALDVLVEDLRYLELVHMHGERNPRCSLRRLVYYFVDNELYNELGWTAVHSYGDAQATKLNRSIATIVEQLYKILSIRPAAKPTVQAILQLLQEVTDEQERH